MATIIAGNFETETQAETAVRSLQGLGIPAERVSSFFVNPPGQHAVFPIGGDHDESPGAEHAEKGAATGAAIGGAVGLAVGLAATPFVGPAAAVGGAGAGAYTGALVGALGTLGEHKNNTPAVGRPAGMMVAVNTSDHIEQALVANGMSKLGARQIEIADGTWLAGKWTDFDTVSEPKPFVGSQRRAEDITTS
jgi:hypothetical protein